MVWAMAVVMLMLFGYFAHKDSGWAVPFFCVGLLTLFVGCETTDAAKERHRQQELEDQKEAAPHVIREADGCKVYAFKTDTYHYFTRCGTSVTTERVYEEACGKNCRKQKSEIITTEGNK